MTEFWHFSKFFRSIRFHNADSSAKSSVTGDKPFLQPGEHEYVNPIHFDGDHCDTSLNFAEKP